MGKFTHQPVKWDSFLSTFNVFFFHTEREDLILGKLGIQGTKKPWQSLVFNEGTWFFFMYLMGVEWGGSISTGESQGIPKSPNCSAICRWYSELI